METLRGGRPTGDAPAPTSSWDREDSEVSHGLLGKFVTLLGVVPMHVYRISCEPWAGPTWPGRCWGLVNILVLAGVFVDGDRQAGAVLKWQL